MKDWLEEWLPLIFVVVAVFGTLGRVYWVVTHYDCTGWHWAAGMNRCDGWIHKSPEPRR